MGPLQLFDYQATIRKDRQLAAGTYAPTADAMGFSKYAPGSWAQYNRAPVAGASGTSNVPDLGRFFRGGLVSAPAGGYVPDLLGLGIALGIVLLLERLRIGP